MSILDEIAVVLAYQKRSLVILLAGMAIALFVWGYGQYILDSLPERSMFSEITRAILSHRADKTAWGIFFAAVVIAIQFYIHDRRRLNNF